MLFAIDITNSFSAIIGFGFDMAIGADDLQQHGFPAVTFSPDCDVDGKPACDRAQFFRPDRGIEAQVDEAGSCDIDRGDPIGVA